MEDKTKRQILFLEARARSLRSTLYTLHSTCYSSTPYSRKSTDYSRQYECYTFELILHPTSYTCAHMDEFCIGIQKITDDNDNNCFSFLSHVRVRITILSSILHTLYICNMYTAYVLKYQMGKI